MEARKHNLGPNLVKRLVPRKPLYLLTFFLMGLTYIPIYKEYIGKKVKKGLFIYFYRSLIELRGGPWPKIQQTLISLGENEAQPVFRFTPKEGQLVT